MSSTRWLKGIINWVVHERLEGEHERLQRCQHYERLQRCQHYERLQRCQHYERLGRWQHETVARETMNESGAV